MRESLIALAAGAVAWAVTVLDVSSNRPFGVFLLALALVLFVFAHYESRATTWWRSRRTQASRWRVRIAVSASLILTASLGWFLLDNFNEKPVAVDTVDTGARNQVSDLRASVATLQGQVEAAMKFQQADEAARKAAQKREDDAHAKRAALYADLSGIIEEGRKARASLFNLKDTGAVERFDQWLSATPKRLRRVTLDDCAQAFERPVHGARIGYGMPQDRDQRAFMAIALIASVEQCRMNHAQL